MAKRQAKTVMTAVEDADLAVTEAMADQRDNPLVRAAGMVSEIGDQPPLRFVSALVMAAGFVARDRRLLRCGVRMLAAHSLATAMKQGIKRSIDRTRPDHALDTRYRMETGDSSAHELSSFPSGHTAGALAVAQAVARDYPALAGRMRLAAALVALVQIPRCKHFVSDIVAGAGIGWAGERLASIVVDRVDTAIDPDLR